MFFLAPEKSGITKQGSLQGTLISLNMSYSCFREKQTIG